MKGSNELHLNLATMLEALQEYFDKRLPGHPIDVTNISQTSQSTPAFKVNVTEREKPVRGASTKEMEDLAKRWGNDGSA